MSIIVIRCADGSVQIMQLVAGEITTVNEEIDLWKWTNPAAYVSHREMPLTAIPADRTFRKAWTDVTPELKIDIDMPKAREVHRERIRAARRPHLEALDVKVMRASESGGDVAAITKQKQALRDLTADPKIETATTPAALMALWPTALDEAPK